MVNGWHRNSRPAFMGYKSSMHTNNSLFAILLSTLAVSHRPKPRRARASVQRMALLRKELTFVHKRVDMLLYQKVFQNSTFCHQPEKVVVAAKEDMQPHLQATLCVKMQALHQLYTPKPLYLRQPGYMQPSAS